MTVSSRWERFDSISVWDLMCLSGQSRKSNTSAFSIHGCCQGSVHRTETTLGILNRKGLNMGKGGLQNNWNYCKNRIKSWNYWAQGRNARAAIQGQKAPVSATTASRDPCHLGLDTERWHLAASTVSWFSCSGLYLPGWTTMERWTLPFL